MLISFLISFFACVIGAICGIGGGIIIKPVLDMFHVGTVAEINFLSGITVLCMSTYSVIRSLKSKSQQIEIKTGTSLAIGAAAGGVAGKMLFGWIKASMGNDGALGTVQSVCLLVLTAGTLLYTLCKSRIRTRQTDSAAVCVLIGLSLGLASSFLGIGGGPFNLVVLYFFFSMDTKTAAVNSLYIIFFSQTANLLVTIFSGSVPDFKTATLVLMAAGGIFGGICGRSINRRISDNKVTLLFELLMAVIVLICILNILRFAGVKM